MTHKDIYTKFMIEYDKANVTSSYPSLTEYEVATVLDKAYNALIAQKVTGNNVRRASFEVDLKAIEDIAPLVIRDTIDLHKNKDIAENVYSGGLPKTMLYFIDGYLTLKVNNGDGPMDGITYRNLPMQLVNHQIAKKFFVTSYNIPWVKQPVCYIEGMKDNYENRTLNVVVSSIGFIENVPFIEEGYKFDGFVDNPHIENTSYLGDPTGVVFDTRNNRFVYLVEEGGLSPSKKYYISFSGSFENKDKYDSPELGNLYKYNDQLYFYNGTTLQEADRAIQSQIVYIKRPNTFVKDLSDTPTTYESFFDWGAGAVPESYKFECNDTIAEELISLAISFALENIESNRLTSKLNMRGLEA